MEKYLYVMFSSTPYKMGEFIRAITKNYYNHISLSIDSSLKCFYSFARRYSAAALYGGFVEESKLRFVKNGKPSGVKIAKIPLSEEQYLCVEAILSDMKERKDDYIYNTISAVSSVFGKKIGIDRSFTCIEFAVHILSRANILPDIDESKNYTIAMLEDKLSEYVFFEGEIEILANDTWGDDEFNTRKNFFSLFGLTLMSYARLIGRFVKGAF